MWTLIMTIQLTLPKGDQKKVMVVETVKLRPLRNTTVGGVTWYSPWYSMIPYYSIVYPWKKYSFVAGERLGEIPLRYYMNITELVGGIPTPLKNMSSSGGMMKFPIYGKMDQSTNQHNIINPYWILMILWMVAKSCTTLDCKNLINHETSPMHPWPLSEKVLSPTPETSSYPSRTSFQKARLDP